MVDRWVTYSLLVLLSSESFLASYVGGPLTQLVVVGPVAILAYRAVAIRLPLSADYRRMTLGFLSRVLRARAHALLFILFVLLLLVSIVRAAQYGTLDIVSAVYETVKWSSVLVLLCVTAMEGWRRAEPAPLLRAVSAGLLFYAGLNLLLFTLGVRNDAMNAQYLSAPDPGMMFGFLGLDVIRGPLPIGGGTNTSGLQVAAGVALGVALARAGLGRRSRGWAILLAAASMVCILITDSRGGILGALAGAGAVFAPRALKRETKWLALAVPVLPLVLMLVLSGLSNEAWFQGFTRGGASSGGALTGRPVVWASIVGFLLAFDPIHLVGYGALGQIGSGVSTRYAFVFANYASPLSAGAHNTVLQAILDVGYVGAAIQILLYWQMLRFFGKSEDNGARTGAWRDAGLAATVCLLFLGITGETLSSTTPITLVLFLALNLHSVTAGRGPSATGANPATDAGQVTAPAS